MKQFKPETAIFKENALEYPLGKELYKKFNSDDKIKTYTISPRGRFPFDYDLPQHRQFYRAKKTVIIAVRTLNRFQSCKPSAHYQLPLVTGCPGHCQYCYLSTNLGKNPYIKIYVNLKQIYERVKKYINERSPEKTIFEGAATSDPLPVEKYSGSLAKTIEFFAQSRLGRFRFVTKFSEVDSLLNIDHQKHTEFRFSLNSNYAVEKFEPATPSPKERIKAAVRVQKAGYPLGFLIAPIFIYDSWQSEYRELLSTLAAQLKSKGKDISFELISHRFTAGAKKIINNVYLHHKLPMNEKEREFKYGQFGYGKYLYPKDVRKNMETFFQKTIRDILPEAKIKYFV